MRTHGEIDTICSYSPANGVALDTRLEVVDSADTTKTGCSAFWRRINDHL